MSIRPEEENARKLLDQTLTGLLSYTPESLVRTSELGTTLDFREGVDIFERTLKLFQSLKDANLDNVPVSVLQRLQKIAEQALNAFKQIQEFSPDQPNPGQVRDGLIQQVEKQYEGQFNAVSPIVAYSVRKGTDFDQLERSARATLVELQRLRTDLEKAGKSLIAEAEASLEQVRRAAAEVGVAQHSIHFKREADAHKNNSWIWLIATGVFAIATLIYGGWNVWYYTTSSIEYTFAQAIQIAVAKLVVFGVLYYAVIWCGRMYRSQMHNYVINQHRQNALSSFETFVKAASDGQVKDAVLIQATQSIFAPQHSGFSDKEPPGEGSPRILEIVRSAATTVNVGEKAPA